ncbi:MAG TPA: nucleoside-diphosphate sugar epimerase/dehydratase [Aggregatilineales bacterium]|nr:nucleoside-diphosphate sugar epimerase/dehydratase [Aggregatilineales bacterium]
MNFVARTGARLGIPVSRYVSIKYAIDLLLWTLAAPLAFVLRLELGVVTYLQPILLYMLTGLVIKGLVLHFYLLHRQAWHKVGVRDLYKLIYAICSATVVLLVLGLMLGPALRIPRSIPLLDGILAVLFLSGARLAMRLYNERLASNAVKQDARRVLIAGAGEAGTMIAREMIRHPHAKLVPVGYVDDDPKKQRQFVVGVPVLGRIADLPRVATQMKVDEVLIAMPSEPGEVIRHVVDLARQARVRYRIIPGVYDILSGKVSISQIREVDVEDLLRRESVRLDLKEIADYLEGRTVLVSGAAGSIGSELVRQIVPFRPGKIVLLDREENNLYLFERELTAEFPELYVHSVVADVRRRPKLDRVFAEYRPEVVFHAAAYKHVPVMEMNPSEAILNNVGGTQNLIEAAEKYGVLRFVNISTDKAVRPTSVMGASKRGAEYLVEAAAARACEGRAFVSVRFGNVLGSRGSVVPIFKQQITRGGPVTITEPEMTRYFMSISEAAQLVLQAAGLGENGAVYVLDMGKPVKIIDLAYDLIRLSGLEPGVDVRIEVVGPRPGEKMHEELLTAEEGTTATRHEKIFCARKSGGPDDLFYERLAALFEAAEACDDEKVRAILKEMLPYYEPQPQAHDYRNVAPYPFDALSIQR